MIWPIRTQLKADTADISALLRQLQEQAAEHHLSDRTSYALSLVAEELLLNIMTHGYQDHPGPIEFEMGVDSEHVRLVFRDQAPPFDPTAAPPDAATADDTPVGGLGLQLVQQTAQSMDYQRTDTGNVLTLTLARED